MLLNQKITACVCSVYVVVWRNSVEFMFRDNIFMVVKFLFSHILFSISLSSLFFCVSFSWECPLWLVDVAIQIMLLLICLLVG